uniref:Translation initiation factor eIF2B subunit delta n=1 Tax=Arcella intermedia TaxID=1963864 RepID=A0A6B2L408_9EUKA
MQQGKGEQGNNQQGKGQPAKGKKGPEIEEQPPEQKNKLFAHLEPYNKPNSLSFQSMINDDIHPAVMGLGLKICNKEIQGANARCDAMLDALELVIKDFSSNDYKVLDTKITSNSNFLGSFRPLSIGMKNALKHIKQSIFDSTNLNPQKAKQCILHQLKRYRESKIIAADKEISLLASQKIQDDDVILIFSSSSVVNKIVIEAHQSRKKKFKIIVADSPPLFEGKSVLKKFGCLGIQCSYVLLTGVSYIMKHVKKVFLGAHAMFSNGSILGRAGSSLIAMLAHSNDIPVLVACETYKFDEKVQIDSICYNELQDPELLLKDYKMFVGEERKEEKRRVPHNLKLLNLAYDVTPMKFVNMVITEIGLIPPTSVPAVIRESEKKAAEDRLNWRTEVYDSD